MGNCRISNGGLRRIKTKGAKIDALKDNIRIRWKGFGWKECETRWTVRSKALTIQELANTAGLPVLYSCTKNQFAKIPRGLRRIRDHRWKALEKTHLNGGGTFFYNYFLVVYFSYLLKKRLCKNVPPPFRCAFPWRSSLRSRIFCVYLQFLAN